MAEERSRAAEPRGFGEHSRGLAGEYAHEQGWNLNEDERTHLSDAPQEIEGKDTYHLRCPVCKGEYDFRGLDPGGANCPHCHGATPDESLRDTTLAPFDTDL